MENPRPGDLAHDLRNLVGVVRALSNQLGSLLGGAGGEVREVVGELDTQARFAMDALRVVEHWSRAEPVEVNLGAWAWALRLARRELVVGDVTGARAAKFSVPRALHAGASMLDALGAGRALRAELAADGAIAFASVARAVDPAALDAALGALGEAGLAARIETAVPCRVRVG